MATPKSVSFHTLGCKLNFTETSAIRRQFEDAGYAVNSFGEYSDIYIINTCSVTDFADKKCRKAVRKAIDINNDARVIVIGCYAQLKPVEIANIPGVDMVLGAAEKFQILEYVDMQASSSDKGLVYAGEVNAVNSFVSSFSYGDRTRSFLKVQDGCDYKCTFCTIPQARGKSRSNDLNEILKDVETLSNQGAKEIVLTGINLGDYKHINENTLAKSNFLSLIKNLEEKTAIPRYRISSIEPNLCSDEIIDFVSSSSSFMPHFHMPLQSGSDRILAAMRRRYRSALYEDRVTHIKQKMPNACIGVDVIVGFPGETHEDFLETYHFLQALPVSYFHVFTYSERANTLAAEMGSPIEMGERRKRNKMLSLLSEKKKRAFYSQYQGEIVDVLFERSKDPSFMTGFSSNYIKVNVPFEADLINTIKPVKLIDLMPNGVFTGQLNPVPV